MHHRVGLPSGARVNQAHGPHRTKAQSVDAATSEFFDRQAGFEVIQIFERVRLNRLGGTQRFVEGEVLALVHRAVQIVFPTLAVARGAKDAVHVQSFRIDDRTDGVIESKVLCPSERPELAGQRV